MLPSKRLPYLLLCAAMLVGCVEDAPQPVSAVSPLPELTANGSEPGWSMTWDGRTMALTYDYGENSLVRNPRFSSPQAKLWHFNDADGLEVTVKEAPCVDDSGATRMYAVQIELMNGAELNGCGKPR